MAATYAFDLAAHRRACRRRRFCDIIVIKMRKAVMSPIIAANY